MSWPSTRVDGAGTVSPCGMGLRLAARSSAAGTVARPAGRVHGGMGRAGSNFPTVGVDAVNGGGMIEFVGAGKRFVSGPRPWRGPVTIDALKDVTLSIPEGGAWGVVGPNGAGKSTLFALLLGFLQPTSGAVRIRGLAPRRYVRRHGAAYLPERFRVPGEWRGRPALVALARLEGLRPDVAARRADEALQRLGLEPFADREVRTLSRGVLQRLGLAQALLGERELLVLDEPTEGLDPLWRIKLRAILEEQRAAGRTIL